MSAALTGWRCAARPVRAWWALTAALLVAYVARFAVRGGPVDAFFDDWVQCGLLLNGCALCLAGARRRRRRRAWVVLAAGLGAWALANVAWSAWIGRMPQPPYPSVSDPLWLAYYPATYAAMVLLVRDRVERLDLSVLLDGLIAALGSAAVAVAVLWPALQGAGGAGTAALVVNMAYPVADVLLLAVLAASLTLTGARMDGALRLIAIGMLLNTAADVTYLLLIADGWSAPASLLDPLWVLAQLCLAAAAWQRVPAPQRRLTGWRHLVLPGGFVAASGALLTVASLRAVATVPCVLAVAALVGAALRAALAYRERSQLQHARREARTDDLTGLGNRRRLYGRLEHLLGAEEAPLALLLLDLDGFKELNDGLGHQAGDDALKLVAARLCAAVPQADLVARLGGDEFVVLVAPADRDGALAAAAAVRDALRPALRVADTDVHVQASIGVALAPEHGHDRDALLGHADAAMYRAKRDASGVELHDAGARLPSTDRLQLASDLHAAIPAGQLIVHFQPKVDLASGAICGAEALVRWQHPERGLLAPDRFLPLAERQGIMPQLTAAVLEQALTEQARWRQAGAGLPVAVNVSGPNLVDAGFPAAVGAALERHGASAADLRLEVTEDTVMADAGRALAVLHALRGLGVELALDDFGTGHSSLAYLKRLPVDELKVDRSFVQAMSHDHRDEAIVEAAARLGRSFGMRVVAEGVEDLPTWLRLRELGCHEAQGWLIARPLGADAFLARVLEDAVPAVPAG